ncbi:hypothetical protein AGDE_06430 [Angomonas deanei]|uniref:Nodulin-like, putative n=1 Tax=Angomonas deanei TaxID=59799 RepID=A0A7G2CTI6_9TRYP|nr:hypothetical protein AGDE_06430 [Angomonas deanei]CAD2222835.1 Nodulin-like, putative [Angomonas deanei]|eukprot:EPY37504.1 hypothetical protein AGDE_06430 [Angomonas deanei]
MNWITDIFSQEKVLKERRASGLHVINELQRFRLLVACIYCAVGTSLVYTFELFTPQFTSQFGLTAGDLSTVSTVSVVFHYFVVPYVVVFQKMGPTLLLVITAVTGLVGTLGMALIFDNKLPHSLVVICVFYAIMNTCVGLFDAATVVTAQLTFPRNRGPVLSLVKVMTGLGSSVFASISRNLFRNDIVSFLYFVLAFAVVVAVWSIFTVTLPPYEMNWWRGRGKTEEEKEIMRSLTAVYYSKSVPMRRLAVGYIVGISLVIFFAISSPVVAYLNVSKEASYGIGAITVFLMLCYFIMTLPIRWLGGVDEPSPSVVQRSAVSQHERDEPAAEEEEEDDLPKKKKADSYEEPVKEKEESAKEKALDDAQSVEGTPVTTAVQAEVDDGNPFAEYGEDQLVTTYCDPRYPKTFWEQLRRVDVYLLYLGFILQGSIGVIVMYNAGTIYVARTGEQRSKELSALYTAFLGVGSAVGRISMGLYEGCVQRQKEGHRRFLVTHALPIPPLIGVIAGVLILVLPGQGLLLPYIMVYFKEGAFYSTCAIVLPSIFATHHAVYYILSSATTVVSVIAFNRLLFGMVVDQQRVKLGYAKGEDCKQRECILTPVIVAICLCAVSFVMLLIVHIRYLRFVRRTEKRKKQNANAIYHS